MTQQRFDESESETNRGVDRVVPEKQRNRKHMELHIVLGAVDYGFP